MLLFKRVQDLQKYLSSCKQLGRSIGFVPTMGALHAGHLSLIDMAKMNTDIVVCSIFVNPTQFDDQDDLAKYPRTLDDDMALLHDQGNNVVFAPSVVEVYPKGLDTSLDVKIGQLSAVMEGAFRKGHFEGMMEVVNRLLDIVLPDQLFMGQKDFQQAAIVNEMLKQTERNTKLILCPIIREESGLARSSRNERLSPEYRKKAAVLNKSLLYAKSNQSSSTVLEIKARAVEMIKDAGLRPEYFEVSNALSLAAIDEWSDSNYVVACLAAYAGEIRLIDNMILKDVREN